MQVDKQQLTTMLQQGPVMVTFTKKDGTLREMRCTLQQGVVVPHEKKTDRVKQQNENVCSVWDLDKNEWRSFNYDSIKEIRNG